MVLKLTPSELETLSDFLYKKINELQFDDRSSEYQIKELSSIYRCVIFELNKLD